MARDSVRLVALLIAAMNDLDVGACDIGNAYLIWFEAGKECGEDAGKGYDHH